MANIVLEKIWRPNLYQWETTDPLIGGLVTVDGNGDIVGPPAGLDNIQGKQLGDRTEFLKWRTASSGPVYRNTILNSVRSGNAPAYINAAAAEILATPTDPFIVTVAGGHDVHGPVNYLVGFTANEVITPEVGTGDEYIYLQYNPISGVYTVFSRATDLISIGPDTPNPGTYKYWYHPLLGKTFEWDGAAWDQIYLTLIGFIDFGGPTANCMAENIDFSGGSSPAGSVVMIATTDIPWGWLDCAGQVVSRADYSRLFAAIGITFGAGDGVSTFKLPDLRGEFVRGWDDGAGIDPARAFGSNQAGIVGEHNHTAANGTFVVNSLDTPSYQADNYVSTNPLKNESDTSMTGVGIGSETRPRNVALKYIIKF
jgi:microcystin-dependent protein